MSHRLYHSEAILLGSRPYGEANRLLYLLTRDFGLLTSAAQAVRQSYSKLRGHLLDYSTLQVSLVRGRHIWRLTSAQLLANSTDSLSPEQRRWWWRLCHLARRLVQGESPQPELFTHFRLWQQELAAAPTPDIRRLALEQHLELLHLLGYVPADNLRAARGQVAETHLVKLVNQALAYSQL